MEPLKYQKFYHVIPLPDNHKSAAGPLTRNVGFELRSGSMVRISPLQAFDDASMAAWIVRLIMNDP